MSKYVSGIDEIANNLVAIRDRTLGRISVVVEKTCIDIANHAKSGHDTNMAHTNSRYRNRTMRLTHSIVPELVEVNSNRVHGVVHTSSVGYASFVEFGIAINVRTGLPNRPYPFLTPALLANKEKFAERLKKVLE